MTPPALAVIVTGVDAVTALVAIAKVALVAPCATDTLAGTVAAAVLLLDRETAKPPAGAGDVSVTVPCDEAPPVTLAGLTATVESDAGGGGGGGGVTVSVALRAAPPNAPLIVRDVDAVTDAVLTVNVALKAPAGTVTLAGTVAALVLLLDSVTTAPPEGAALVRLAVPCEVLPPTTLAGLSAIPASEGAWVKAPGSEAPNRGPRTRGAGRVDAPYAPPVPPPRVERRSGELRRRDDPIDDERSGEVVRVVDLDAIRRRRADVRPVEGHRLRGRRILRRAEERRRRRVSAAEQPPSS